MTTDKGLHGDDDRLQVADVLGDPDLLEPTRATPMLVYAGVPLRHDVGQQVLDLLMTAPPLGERVEDVMGGPACEHMRFRNEPVMPKGSGSSSGFLVDAQLLVTAGHSIRTQDTCDELAIAFGYEYRGASDPKAIDPDDVRRCARVLRRRYYDDGDYALLWLERPYDLGAHPPLSLQRSEDRSPRSVTAIGYPLGIPLKLHPGEIVERTPLGWTSTVDGYQGISGGPLLDMETGAVAAITVSGSDRLFMAASPTTSDARIAGAVGPDLDDVCFDWAGDLPGQYAQHQSVDPLIETVEMLSQNRVSVHFWRLDDTSGAPRSFEASVEQNVAGRVLSLLIAYELPGSGPNACSDTRIVVEHDGDVLLEADLGLLERRDEDQPAGFMRDLAAAEGRPARGRWRVRATSPSSDNCATARASLTLLAVD